MATANNRPLSNNNLRFGNFPNSFIEAVKKLSVAIRDNNLPVVIEAIDEGADLTKKHGGLTPLMYASTLCRSEIVRILLPNSDLNATDRDGMNSLLLACDNESRPEDVATVELLLDAGADVNSTNNRGQTPLMLAKMNENKDLVKILLDHGATNTANSHKNRKSRKFRKSHKATRKSRKSRKSRKATRRR